jgi:hypothetical protein
MPAPSRRLICVASRQPGCDMPQLNGEPWREPSYSYSCRDTNTRINSRREEAAARGEREAPLHTRFLLLLLLYKMTR